MHHHEGRIASGRVEVRGLEEERLDVEAVPAPKAHLRGLDHAPPRSGEEGQAAAAPTSHRHVVHFGAPRRGRPQEDEAGAVGRGVVRPEGAAHVRHARRHAALRGHPPQLDLSTLVVGEVELASVRGPRHGVVVQPVGGVHLHRHDALRAGVGVDQIDVGQVLVPVLVLGRPEERDACPVG